MAIARTRRGSSGYPCAPCVTRSGNIRPRERRAQGLGHDETSLSGDRKSPAASDEATGQGPPLASAKAATRRRMKDHASNFVPIRNATRKNANSNMLIGCCRAVPPSFSLFLKGPQPRIRYLSTVSARSPARRGPPADCVGDCRRGLSRRIDTGGSRWWSFPFFLQPPSLD